MIRIEQRPLILPFLERGVVINPVNCRGVMGAGFALAVRTQWPRVYADYRRLCAYRDPRTLLGTNQILRVAQEVFVANAFTQLNYGRSGRYADLGAIERCFHSLLNRLKDYPIPIHSPAIGCGLGGLSWEEVYPVFDKLSQLFPEQELTFWLGNRE